MIAIIDYGVGNLFSLTASLKSLGAEVVVTNDSSDVLSAYVVAAEYCDNNLVQTDVEKLYAKSGETVRTGVNLAGSNGDVKIILVDQKTLEPLLSDVLHLSQE